MDRVAPNAFVLLDYVLKDEDGETLDDSSADGGEPIRYVHGYGMLVPGLEKQLVGLGAGEKKTFTVPADEAYGSYDDELVLEIDRTEIPNADGVQEGDELVATDGDGDEAHLRVVEVKPDVVVVDGNHPLAGIALRYEVAIREVRAATDTEMESAAKGFEEHEHVHGPDCNHGEPDEKLVTLGTSKPKPDLPN
jgi:FKBP-type peptidyl-prolyl cis-trans isomerase SlyD